MPAIVWVQRVLRRIKVLTERLGPVKAILDHGEKALVWVKMLMFVPIQAGEAEHGPQQKDACQDDCHDSGIHGYITEAPPNVTTGPIEVGPSHAGRDLGLRLALRFEGHSLCHPSIALHSR